MRVSQKLGISIIVIALCFIACIFIFVGFSFNEETTDIEDMPVPLCDDEDYVTPEMYGAVGDGVTDDSDAINNALQSGFPVMLSAKTYLCHKSIRMPSGAELYGEGSASVLYNDVKWGYDKNVIIAGLANSRENAGSSLTVNKYLVTGDRTGTSFAVDNASSSFSVGDVVLFTDGSKIQESDACRAYRYMDAAKVTEVGDDLVTVDSTITNNKVLEGAELYIVNFSDISDIYSSEFGGYLYIADNVKVHDLTIQLQYPEEGSGMYAIYCNCIDSSFERINFVNVSTPVGSNAFIRSALKDCNATYAGGITDMAEIQIRSTYENLTYERMGHNSNHQYEGFVISNGYGCSAANIDINNGDMAGAYRCCYMYDITFTNCTYTSSCTPGQGQWVFFTNPVDDTIYLIDCYNYSDLPLCSSPCYVSYTFE